MNGRMNGSPGNSAPFGPRAMVALVCVGFIAFVALLAAMGTREPRADNGGAHGLGKGISGYAALAAMLSAEGRTVDFTRMPGSAEANALLIVTPLAWADGKDIAQVVNRHRLTGPVLVVTPKWQAVPLTSDPRVTPSRWNPFGAPKPPRGWSTVVGTEPPEWKGFLDRTSVRLEQPGGPPAHGWRSADGQSSGPLPDDHVVLSGQGEDDGHHGITPLVTSADGRVLAGYFADGGAYPALDRMAGLTAPTGEDRDMHPLVIVFEPDLLDNMGLADRQTGLLADRLIRAAAGDAEGDAAARPIAFDLSLAGLGQPRNLLSLAFQPPFLAATICLILAAAASIWLGLARFGPALVAAPAIASGKVALVTGSAELILRARRHHLIGAPYAEAARERLIAALGLPRRRPEAETDAAIDRILETRMPGTIPFSTAAHQLGSARRAHDIAAAAAQIHRIERALVTMRKA
ncbi:hypothetical protein Y88_2221 [Novosphingobium nitrogenifigens DSM 19370]|uniref:DUF4350 domain-containing protein n=2 Tax=Novosphingobium nitrogenifigens TaxID=378548 RepID=F1Z5G9_9SPHN|nr:hypothetical protein Y88_2221 [Novosphingobium nitrogenifigens DSM 19370]